MRRNQLIARQSAPDTDAPVTPKAARQGAKRAPVRATVPPAAKKRATARKTGKAGR